VTIVRILVPLVLALSAYAQVLSGLGAAELEGTQSALQMRPMVSHPPGDSALDARRYEEVGVNPLTPTRTGPGSGRITPAVLSEVAVPEARGRGLQDGWAIDNSCQVLFTPEVAEAIADAGAQWVRINFRLGASATWTDPTCNGLSARALYDTVVDNARAEGLQVMGLLSNESWPGTQQEWQANSVEWIGGSGDNPYLVAFSKNAAAVLAQHFEGRVAAWEVWNEPNAYTSFSPFTGYTGSTFIYPSNFAWLLRHVYEEAGAAGVTGTLFVSGGVFGHDMTSALTPSGAGVELKRGDPQTPGYFAPLGSSERDAPLPADPVAEKSGAEYLRLTYARGIARAGWGALPAYPLDGIGQHIYVDQGTTTSAAKIAAYLAAVRAVPLEHPEAPPPPTWITEVGWPTYTESFYATQAANLRIAYAEFAATPYVAVPFWFQLRDIEGAHLFYGLLTPFAPQWTRKPAWWAFHQHRVFVPMLLAAPGEPSARAVALAANREVMARIEEVLGNRPG
jgi:hypothetical protein